MLFLSNFLVGFSCTLFLFIISLIIVLSFRLIYLTAKDLAQKQPEPKPKEKRKKRKKPNVAESQPAVVHSVEIDPTKIDKIYVKKSS